MPASSFTQQLSLAPFEHVPIANLSVFGALPKKKSQEVAGSAVPM
jgi:hypothetical protein